MATVILPDTSVPGSIPKPETKTARPSVSRFDDGVHSACQFLLDAFEQRRGLRETRIKKEKI